MTRITLLSGWRCDYAYMESPEIQAVLQFWFRPLEQDTPDIDARMNHWYGSNAAVDQHIADEFAELTARALTGALDFWAKTPRGRLALILLLDQFLRRLHPESPEAFLGDRKALRTCEQGVRQEAYKALTAEQRLFYFMPLQRAESLQIQQTAVRIYNSLAKQSSATMRKTFETIAQFAELRRDVIEQFGRFPHRNAVLGRTNTPAEDKYLGMGLALAG